MEWIDVSPDQNDWVKQINIMAYYGSLKVGSLVLHEEDYWLAVIDGHETDLDARSPEEAKEEMKEVLEQHFDEQINYYEELGKMLTK